MLRAGDRTRFRRSSVHAIARTKRPAAHGPAVRRNRARPFDHLSQPEKIPTPGTLGGGQRREPPLRLFPRCVLFAILLSIPIEEFFHVA